MPYCHACVRVRRTPGSLLPRSSCSISLPAFLCSLKVTRPRQAWVLSFGVTCSCRVIGVMHGAWRRLFNLANCFVHWNVKHVLVDLCGRCGKLRRAYWRKVKCVAGKLVIRLIQTFHNSSSKSTWLGAYCTLQPAHDINVFISTQ